MSLRLLIIAAAFLSRSMFASDASLASTIRDIELIAECPENKDASKDEMVLQVDSSGSITNETRDDSSEMDIDSDSWIQQGLPVTENSLNMAIVGQGFFWVIDGATGALKVTRDGRFQIDANGNLVHWENGDQVLKYTDGGISNIRITDAATIKNSSTNEVSHLKHIDVTEDGSIIGSYEGGELRQIARLVIVDFENPRKLKRVGQHLFEATTESGLPRTSGKSIILGKTIENLDEDIYERLGFDTW